MKTRFVFQTLIVTLAFVFSTNVYAENVRVLIVHTGTGDPMMGHLVDELVALGFTVEIVPPGEYEMAALAKQRNARAIMRIVTSRRGIELWTNNKGGLTRIEEKPEEKGDLATLSLRAVEELRGQLLATATLPIENRPEENATPFAPLPHETAGPLPLPTIETKPRTDPLRPNERVLPQKLPAAVKSWGQFWLHLAPAAIVHPGSGGMTSGGAALVSVRFMPLERFGVDFVAFVPIVPSTISSPVGNVNIAASGVLLGGWVEVFRPVPTVRFGLGAGVGGGIFHHYGQPQTAGIEARDGNVAYGLPYARSALAWAITPNLALRADILAAIATPRPVLRLPGRTSDVYFGQPLLTIGLGLDLKLK